MFFIHEKQKSQNNPHFHSLAALQPPLHSAGAIKAYLHSKHPEVEVHADHAFLKIAASLGYPLYHEISERTWLAEAVYAALLYPQRFDVIEKLFNRLAKPGSLTKKTGFKKITSLIKKTTDALIADCNWKNYQLAGFSVSLCQALSADEKSERPTAPGLRRLFRTLEILGSPEYVLCDLAG